MSHDLSPSPQPPPSNPANVPSSAFFSGISLQPGARVLDVGCGNGDLSRYMAGIAGPGGEVVGIDRSEQALAAARAFDPPPGGAAVHYHAADLAGELPDLGRFDAIVGRRVLMYLPDAAKTLSRLMAIAKPGAVIAFQEHGRTTLPAANVDLPLHRQLYDWHWSTVEAEGGDVGLALRLADVMRSLGLSDVNVRAEAIMLDCGQPSFLPTLTQMMLPRMVERDITTPEQVDLATLSKRVADEQNKAGGLIVWDLAFLVMATVPPRR